MRSSPPSPFAREHAGFRTCMSTNGRPKPEPMPVVIRLTPGQKSSLSDDWRKPVAYRLLHWPIAATASLGGWRRTEVMEDNMSDFIRHLRRQLGMTQEEFAHSLGITVGTVNRWENGRFRPSKLARSTILEFARRHGVTLRNDADGSLPDDEEPLH